jgi:hypothetical protein
MCADSQFGKMILFKGLGLCPKCLIQLAVTDVDEGGGAGGRLGVAGVCGCICLNFILMMFSRVIRAPSFASFVSFGELFSPEAAGPARRAVSSIPANAQRIMMNFSLSTIHLS